jgi:hypothetical protein
LRGGQEVNTSKLLTKKDVLYVKLTRKFIEELAVKKANSISDFEDLDCGINDLNILVKTANQSEEENLNIIKSEIIDKK